MNTGYNLEIWTASIFPQHISFEVKVLRYNDFVTFFNPITFTNIHLF